MNLASTGKTIADLRKAAGLTQYSLAEKLGISDKAVSKWERGIACPDVSLWSKLSILLDTDIETLIYGNDEAKDWKGILCLDASIPAETTIYNKRLVEYLISQFLLVGINKIAIIGQCREFSFPGVQIFFVENCTQLNHWFTGNLFIIYGNNFIYGPNFTKHIKRAMTRTDGITILASMKKKGKCPLVVDENKVARVTNKQVINQFYAEPFVFIPSGVKFPLNLQFPEVIEERAFNVETMVRGMAGFNIDSWNSAFEMAEFVKIIENITGDKVGCVEELLVRRGVATYEDVNKICSEDTRQYLCTIFED